LQSGNKEEEEVDGGEVAGGEGKAKDEDLDKQDP